MGVKDALREDALEGAPCMSPRSEEFDDFLTSAGDDVREGGRGEAREAVREGARLRLATLELRRSELGGTLGGLGG